ncbi:glycosyltransferase [Streptomyces sp. JNUCC 64]
MRIGLLTEGGYPYVDGEGRLWCDRLVRGLAAHRFDVYALSRDERQHRGPRVELPPHIGRVRTAAPLGAAGADGSGTGTSRKAWGRGARRRFAECYRELADALCAPGAFAREERAEPDARDVSGTSGGGPEAGRRAGGGGGASDRLDASGFGKAPADRSGTPGRRETSDWGRIPDHRGTSDRGGAFWPPHGPEGVVADPIGRPTLLEDRFSNALYALADLVRDTPGSAPGLTAALRSEAALRVLEAACRAPGASRSARHARVPDLLAVAAHLTVALRPLSLDWYGPGLLGDVDLCHAATGGGAALAGLLARRHDGVPLLVTEYGLPLRPHDPAGWTGHAGHTGHAGRAGWPGRTGGAGRGAPVGAPARALLAGYRRRLATEVYRRADLVTPGSARVRRWQEHCGADPARLRMVRPGTDHAPSTAPAGRPGRTDSRTLLWVGAVDPTKDLVSLLRAFARVRHAEPGARLRIVSGPVGPRAAGYLAHCHAVAERLFPGTTPGPSHPGRLSHPPCPSRASGAPRPPGPARPVVFEECGAGGAGGSDLAEAYRDAGVVVLSSVVEGFPVSLLEAMFAGRATVSTDVGAVAEVVGGTGLVVPPGDSTALARACVTLLRDPARRERLGAAARARALQLFGVEQNLTAFDGIYRELGSRRTGRRPARAVQTPGTSRTVRPIVRTATAGIHDGEGVR